MHNITEHSELACARESFLTLAWVKWQLSFLRATRS